MGKLLDYFAGLFKKNKTGNNSEDPQESQEESLDELALLSSNPALQQLGMMLRSCDNILTFLDTQRSNPLLESPEVARLWSEQYGTAPFPGLISNIDDSSKTNDLASSKTDSVKESDEKEKNKLKPRLLPILDRFNKQLSLIEQKLVTLQIDVAAKEEARNEVLLILQKILTIVQQQEKQLLDIQQGQESAPQFNVMRILQQQLYLNRSQRLLNKIQKLLRSKLKAFRPKPSPSKSKSGQEGLIFTDLATMQKQDSPQATPRGGVMGLLSNPSLMEQRSRSNQLEGIAATWPKDINNQEVSLDQQPLGQISAQNNPLAPPTTLGSLTVNNLGSKVSEASDDLSRRGGPKTPRLTFPGTLKGG